MIVHRGGYVAEPQDGLCHAIAVAVLQEGGENALKGRTSRGEVPEVERDPTERERGPRGHKGGSQPLRMREALLEPVTRTLGLADAEEQFPQQTQRIRSCFQNGRVVGR